jgi:3-hydroxyisobutyrate dehydrogenase
MPTSPNATPTVVAVLGTGLMGLGMATNLARADFTVRAWNRTHDRAEPLAAVGVTVVDTPWDAVAGADVVLTMLFDAPATLEVMDQARGALSAGTLWIQSATVGLDGCARLAALAAELDLVYVDAPVLGTRQPAMAGQLTVLASGPERAKVRCSPIFDAVSRRVVWAGPAGSGSKLKLVCNSWVVTLVEGAAEAIRLAKGLDIDPALFLEACSGAPVDSPYLQSKGRMILEENYTAQFTLEAATKDVHFILGEAARLGLGLGMFEAIGRRFDATIEAGHGGDDVIATHLTL